MAASSQEQHDCCHWRSCCYHHKHIGLLQSKRASLVLLLSAAVHLINILHTLYQDRPLFYVYSGVTSGLLLLLYPQSGWLADVYFTRFRTMFAGLVCVLLGTVISITMSFVYQNVVLLGFTLTVIGYALFEVNAIQFGLDQLQFYSVQSHRDFVYWYFFTTQLGHTIYGLTQCGIMQATYSRATAILLNDAIMGSVQVILLLLIAILVCVWRSKFTHHLTGFHPYKMILQVLKAAITNRHLQPKRAPRIEYTKSKYGGPFSAQQVDDVKLFFFILLLLFPLSGYHYVDKAHSITQQFFVSSTSANDYGRCLIVDVPNWILSALTTALIPFYLLVVSPILQQGSYRSFGLLWTMGIGLALSVFSIVAFFGIEMKVALAHVSSPNLTTHTNLTDCFAGDVLSFNWLLIPEFFSSLSYLIVFSTALEFICAQSPLNMRGLLIGMWYAFTGLDVLLVTLQNHFQLECYPGYLIAKAAIVTGCLLMFAAMAYKYRKHRKSANKHSNEEEDGVYVEISDSNKLDESISENPYQSGILSHHVNYSQ